MLDLQAVCLNPDCYCERVGEKRRVGESSLVEMTDVRYIRGDGRLNFALAALSRIVPGSGQFCEPNLWVDISAVRRYLMRSISAILSKLPSENHME